MNSVLPSISLGIAFGVAEVLVTVLGNQLLTNHDYLLPDFSSRFAIGFLTAIAFLCRFVRFWPTPWWVCAVWSSERALGCASQAASGLD
jgi:hypothetical protein